MAYQFRRCIKKAQFFYEEALKLSQNVFGEHELTSTCFKNFGDLFLTAKQYTMAESNYKFAKKMRENLGLHTSKSHAYLLKNLGICLKEIGQSEEAIEILERALDFAEKLFESEESNDCRAKLYANLAIIYHSIQPFCEDAVTYAKKAIELENIEQLARFEYQLLLTISKNGASEN